MARFTNQAQLRYGNSVANSNIAVGEILEVLSATKTAVRKVYEQDDTITYVISVVNSGTVPLNGMTVTDNLGTYAFDATTLTPLVYVTDTVNYYINGVLQPKPTVTPGAPLAISGLNIPAGGNIVLVYEAKLNEYAPLAGESEITNTVTISGGGITPIQVEETVQALSNPVLTITKSISPVPVTENGTLTYTFLIQNNGNTAAEEGTAAVITDDFDPILNNLTVSFNGTAWTEGVDYTYDETTGSFATIACVSVFWYFPPCGINTEPAPIEPSNISTRPFCEHTFRSFNVSNHFALTSFTSSLVRIVSLRLGISTVTVVS